MKRVLTIILCSALVIIGSVAGTVAVSAKGGPTTYMPAYYDGKLFTINFMQLPPNAEKNTELHNKSINIIYQSDSAVAAGFNFISVLDAIQGDGFNPLWEEWQITFLTIAPKQFLSDTEILAAAAAGQISLADTNEMYICAVVKNKK